MKLLEHNVVRELRENEINKAIEDFKNTTPFLNTDVGGEWNPKDDENEKNLTFKDYYESIIGNELTPKEIKNKIIDFLDYDMFIDLIYPMWCKDKKTCVEAIEQAELYWLFYVENFQTYDKFGNDVNLGSLYIKLNTISGEIFVVKSLHRLGYHKSSNKVKNERNLKFIKYYDEYMNGKIK